MLQFSRLRIVNGCPVKSRRGHVSKILVLFIREDLMYRVDLRSVKDNFNLGGTVHEGGLFPRTIEAFQFLGPLWGEFRSPGVSSTNASYFSLSGRWLSAFL